jgi:hypothetical protein
MDCLKMHWRPVGFGTRRLTQAPSRRVDLRVTTLNSYLFGSPTCFDYRLAGSSDRGARMAKGNARHFWNSQS